MKKKKKPEICNSNQTTLAAIYDPVVVFSRIVRIISLPNLAASGKRGAKYLWIRSNRSR